MPSKDPATIMFEGLMQEISKSFRRTPVEKIEEAATGDGAAAYDQYVARTQVKGGSAHNVGADAAVVAEVVKRATLVIQKSGQKMART